MIIAGSYNNNENKIGDSKRLIYHGSRDDYCPLSFLSRKVL